MRICLTACLLMLVSWHMTPPASAQKADPEVKLLVDGNNDFGATLYQQLAQKDGNVFFSPYSISNAFGMCHAGARGNTAAEMKTTLRFNLGDDRLHPVFGKLIGQLESTDKKRKLQLSIANRLWGQKDFGFAPDFLKVGSDHYRAGLEEVDFINATEDARKTINTWVEKQTKDKIKDLLPNGSLTVDSRLVLTNAIYFKAAWMTPFRKEQTKPESFHLAGGKTIKTPMMKGSVRTNYADLDGFSMVQLPYDGYQQSMIVILPKKGAALGEVEKKLTAANLASWLGKLGDREVDLKLPKFKVTAEFQLTDVLKAMGMKDAFVPGTANFSGMATRQKLFISAVLHKAFVDVNEEGTEAAAATGIVVGVTSLPQPATFHADRPFLFLIRDHATGSILFLGRVVNPA